MPSEEEMYKSLDQVQRNLTKAEEQKLNELTQPRWSINELERNEDEGLRTKLKQMKRIVEKKLLEDFCAAFKKKYYYHIVHQLTEQHYKDIVEEFLDERSKKNE